MQAADDIHAAQGQEGEQDVSAEGAVAHEDVAGLEYKKTVSVALSQEQYEAMKEAIANWRVLQRALVRMEQVTRLMIFRTLPDTRRRKPLTKRVLGLN
jgi:hypothetical protein